MQKHHKRLKLKVQHPRIDYDMLYRTLTVELGLPDGPQGFISSDMTPKQAAADALAASFYKKLSPTGKSPMADAAALTKFVEVNRSLSENYQFDPQLSVEADFYMYFKYHVNRCLRTRELTGAFSLDDLGRLMTTGPGAAQKADARTWVTKVFQSPLSYTNPDLIRIYRAALSNTGLYAEAEMSRWQRFGFEQVAGGKIFFAPKNSEISRTCCTEPGLNVLIQLGIGSYIAECVATYFGISLSTQPDINGELARLGSIDGTIGTTDQSSASDSIGLSLINEVVESSLIKQLILLSRCEVAVLPNGDIERLRMVSTMGNGFTFPLQTLLFASVVRAAFDTFGVKQTPEWGVFGDDIIVPQWTFEFVNRMLIKLGFSVNRNKSFNSGLFRESCGCDYYRGHLVRGVYVKSLETPEDVYSVINRLTRWSAWHDIMIPRTLSILWSWSQRNAVPSSEADTVGVHVPFRLSKGLPVTDNYWYRYRALVRNKRAFEAYEPDDDKCINPLGTASGIINGVYRRPERAISSTTWSDPGKLGSFLRDPRGARPRTQIVKRALPFWDYVKPDSEPGEAWLPKLSDPKNAEFEREQYTHWRLAERLARGRWEAVVEAFILDS